MAVVYIAPVARAVPFDNTSNGFTATNVQSAIEEVSNGGGVGVSPGLTWGRSGNVSADTWLQNETVPSNKAGRFLEVTSGKIIQIYAANEDVNTFTIQIYWHEGNEVNLTLLTSLTVTAARGDSINVNVSVPSGKQLAAKLSSGSAKNLVAGIFVKGSAS